MVAVLALVRTQRFEVGTPMKRMHVYAARYDGDAGPVDFTEVARSVLPATVRVRAKITNRWGDPGISAGSGAILSEDGYIVTNYHVVKAAEGVTVILNNHRMFKATIVGMDASADLAVLKIAAQGLPTLDYGHSEELKVGQWVLTSGYPLGLEATVTAGIISSKNDTFIQTDAAVNLGSSGGPLIDREGKLIGINAALQTSTGAYVGYSFAIPANTVKRVVNRIIGGGGKGMIRS